ncbi:hypothetical protein KJ784_04185, partial [Patescibacteria group bacterium]|nr:hypothetical protein [Patescibacteria group bacterium]
MADFIHILRELFKACFFSRLLLRFGYKLNSRMSLKDQVAKLIEKEINLPFAVLSILAVILIRACLELFSSPWYLGDIFSAFFIFLNFPLYFCSVIFSLVLITYYFTGLE